MRLFRGEKKRLSSAVIGIREREGGRSWVWCVRGLGAGDEAGVASDGIRGLWGLTMGFSYSLFLITTNLPISLDFSLVVLGWLYTDISLYPP